LCDLKKLGELNITLEVLFALSPLIAHLPASKITEAVAENDQHEPDSITFLTNNKILSILEYQGQVIKGQSHWMGTNEVWLLVGG